MNTISTTAGQATISLGGDLHVGRVGYGAMQLTAPTGGAPTPTITAASPYCDKPSKRA
jgi:hypothetical protein